jgi:RHS repeat-associated protein
LRYIDLMGGQKPHLLIKTLNNLGAETLINYASSTKFYLADKAAGTPWITKIPFPIHCVEKVTVSDKWRKTTFSTSYSYHHGYFDGFEREFRGFGRVEQVDVESYGEFAAGNAASPYITEEKTLYQPPVKTVTWFHTGASVNRETILSHFAEEYFPHGFELLLPEEANVLGTFREAALPEPELAAQDLTTDEWREALRACKGMALRQEVYELDVDALEDGEHRPVKLFSAAAHTCQIQRLQSHGTNRHAVFLVTESEVISYHYELDLRASTVHPDPRIVHTLNLATDQYGNVLQSVVAVYPRLEQFDDPMLGREDHARLRAMQREMHLAYTENRYTNDVDEPDDHRQRAPCEVLTYELTGIQPGHSYFSLHELRSYWLSQVHQRDGRVVPEIPYHQIPTGTVPQKRCVEHVRMLYFQENLHDPLPFGTLNRLGLPYENYKLAMTEELLAAIFQDKLTPDVRRQLGEALISGYLSGAALRSRFGDAPGQYLIRSGIAGFQDDAADHFYLPERYTDPFGKVTTLAFDSRDLFLESSTDALGNVTLVEQFDFRVLAPRRLRDINDNLSEVAFDILGLPAASAVMGKGTEGDDFSTFGDALPDPTLATLTLFFTHDYDEVQARRLLGNATTRHLVYFGEVSNADGSVTWGVHPACSSGIVCERHVGQLAAGEISPLQTAFEYTDGLCSVLVKKVQAEPENEGGPLRWITSGKTVLNNKGKPVKQYEPYFSDSGQRFEEPREVGVTPVLYYDAAGRLIRTESPDGSFSRVEFSPWQVVHYDANDTVLEPGNTWYSAQHPLDPDRSLPADPITGQILATPEQRAAWLAAQHANTPALTLLDSLGRDVAVIAHNKYRDRDNVLHDEKYVTFTRLDAEGKPLWVRDARGNLVMQYITPIKPTRGGDEADGSQSEAMPLDSVPCYGISGNLLFQHSMDAGDRWMLMDAAGKPMLAWDINERQTDSGAVDEQRLYSTEYDALHRPTAQWLRINGEARQMVERFDYRDTRSADGAANPRASEDRHANLLGQLVRHYDSSGLVETVRRDFKGNVLETRRTLARAYDALVVDWSPGSHTTELETETFAQITEYDALNRMTRQYNWHKVIPDSRVAVYEPRYNARGLLASEDLFIRAVKKPEGYEGGQRTSAIRSIAYDAKGQKERIDYGNGTITRYDYDPETFRLRQLRTTRSGLTEQFPGYHSSLRNPDVLQQLSYTYDTIGNITEIYDEAYEPIFFRNQVVEPRSRYTYDALYRLIEANGREHASVSAAPGQFQNDPDHIGFPIFGSGALRNYTQLYRYDAVGNIEEMHHVAAPTGSWTRHYEYAADSNRLLRTWKGANHWEDATATNKVTYRYDTHGSMLNLADVPEEYRLRWDYRDMIHTVNLGGGGWAYYSYEAGKERTRKVITNRVGVKQWERFYLGGLEVYRRYGPGGIVDEIETHHLFVGGQRMLLVEDVLPPDNTGLGVGARLRYQYGNHLGSACVELDETAAVITYEEYHPYGTSAYRAGRSAAEVSLKRYRCTEKERDGETGLSYHSARYYAPWLGRWASADPAGLDDGVNPYEYGRDNPLMFRDSTGLTSRYWESPSGTRVEIRGEPPDVAALGVAPGRGHYRRTSENRYEYINPVHRRRLLNPPRATAPAGSSTIAPTSSNAAATQTSHDAAYANAGLDSLQTSLTLIGMVPGLGAVADVLNAGLYVLRGDYANAAMSAASIVPFVGIFGTVGRFGNRAAHALEAGADIVRVAENASSAVRASDAATDLVRAAEFASSTERVTETGATALRTAENVGPSVGAVRAETRVLEGEEFMAELTSRYNAEKASMDSGHFVDFSDYVHTDVNIGSLRGSRRADFSAADAIAASERPGWRRPPHHTWHHHEDLGRMQLVPTRVHRGRGLDHAGGVSIWLRVFGRQSRRGY